MTDKATLPESDTRGTDIDASSMDENYTLRTITDIPSIAGIRPVWEEMQAHPDSDIDHYLDVILPDPNVIRPHVILLERAGTPVSLIIGRLEHRRFGIKMAGRRMHTPACRCVTIGYGGLLGELTESTCDVLFRELTRPLLDGSADVLRMHYLDVRSGFYQRATTTRGILARDWLATPTTHWRMALPESIDAFYSSRSSKHRYWLRRMVRLLERDYPAAVEHVTVTEEKDLPTLFADAETVARQTYQRALQVGFVNREDVRSLLAKSARAGSMRAYLTYVQGAPCAYWIGWRYKSVFHLLFTGYDQKFRPYELGTTLFVKMVEDLCAQSNIRYIDFGFGDAPYKSRFGDEKWEEATTHVFAPRFKGIQINTLRMATDGTSRLAALWLQKLGVLERAKRLRRRYLGKKQAESEEERNTPVRQENP